jgi:hypothetical protein
MGPLWPCRRVAPRVYAPGPPIVKMDWVEGNPLGVWLDASFSKAADLQNTRPQFRSISSFLEKEGIALGDIQNGNVMIAPGGPRLIDYDGMFVPGMVSICVTPQPHSRTMLAVRSRLHHRTVPQATRSNCLITRGQFSQRISRLSCHHLSQMLRCRLRCRQKSVLDSSAHSTETEPTNNQPTQPGQPNQLLEVTIAADVEVLQRRLAELSFYSGKPCDFNSIQRETSAWRIQARCTRGMETWIAHIRILRTQNRLIWSSERGTAEHVPCRQATR